MNFEKLFDLILANPDNISITYSNINGKETLKVNGKEVNEFDDSQIKKDIAHYKEIIDKLDSCIFVEVLERVGEHIDLKELDTLLEKEHFTEEEADKITEELNTIKGAFICELHNKIEEYKELINEI